MKKILIVDDNAVVRRLHVEMVQKLGYDTASAKNGQEALSLLSEDNYYLAMIDIFMPIMDGFELIRQIRQIHKHIKIIAISGGVASLGDTQIYLEIAKQLGAITVLEKPISKEIIGQVLKDACRDYNAATDPSWPL